MEKFTGIRITSTERKLSRAILECIKHLKKVHSFSFTSEYTYSLDTIVQMLNISDFKALRVKTEVRTPAIKRYNVVPVFDANKLYHREGESGALYPFYSIPKKTLVAVKMLADRQFLFASEVDICVYIFGKDSEGYKGLFHYQGNYWSVSGIKLTRTLASDGAAQTNLECNQSCANPISLYLDQHKKLRYHLANVTGVFS